MAAAGSNASAAMLGDTSTAVSTTSAAAAPTAESITESALAWAQWARVAVVIALLFPVGLLLGMFLPTGIDAAVDASGNDLAVRGRLVAWCWAVNGFFSVIGSSVTTILSMAFGFNRALLAGLTMYVLAVVMQQLTTRRPLAPA